MAIDETQIMSMVIAIKQQQAELDMLKSKLASIENSVDKTRAEAFAADDSFLKAQNHVVGKLQQQEVTITALEHKLAHQTAPRISDEDLEKVALWLISRLSSR